MSGAVPRTSSGVYSYPFSTRIAKNDQCAARLRTTNILMSLCDWGSSDARYIGRVREKELWTRLREVLGGAYATTWASQVVLSELNGRTAQEALDAGEAPKKVWLAVWRHLELPDSER